MYGVTNQDRELAIKKINNQTLFLSNSYLLRDQKKIYLIDFFKNAFINPDRYIAEVNHRVWSLYDYAKERNLVNVFITLTLPREYHPTKQVRYKNNKIYSKPNKQYNPELTPHKGSIALTKMFQEVRQLRAFRDIPKDDRCFFKVIEPHKDGTQHAHISIFIPKNSVEKFVEAFKNKFKKTEGIDIQTNIQNPVSYLMKYVLKTFDDLREEKHITDLTIWYIANKIIRFSTSRTLISLDTYRVLGGKYNMLELTKLYRNNDIRILLEITRDKDGADKVGKIARIEEYVEEIGLYVPIYNRFPFNPTYETNNRFYPSLKSQEKKEKQYHDFDFEYEGVRERFRILKDGTLLEIGNHKTPYSRYSDFALMQKYQLLRHSLDDSIDSLNQFKVIKEIAISRGLLKREIECCMELAG